MAHAPISLGSGGGYGSDDCTASLDYVLSGKTAIASDSNDEPGNGRMTVNSLLSFSCAAYSGRRVLAKWGNPKAAIGRPYSGVYIRYSTSGYPGKTGGTQIYKGAGSNTASQGQSQAYLDMPALNTTYYLSCTPYVTTNQGDLLGDTLNTTVRTSNILIVTIKATQTYTIPVGFTKMDTFTVGGGGGAHSGDIGSSGQYGAGRGGGGAGGGFTKTVKGTAISAGKVLSCTVGAGGAGAIQPTKQQETTWGGPGGTTSIIMDGVMINSASGGHDSSYGGANGGSGGGGTGYYVPYSNDSSSGTGGSDGSDGASDSSGSYYGGKGQGSTTRAFGEPSGTLYGSGGGAGGGGTGTVCRWGANGGPGAGKGGNGGWQISDTSEGKEWKSPTGGGSGTANTGGGGGGGGGAPRNSYSSHMLGAAGGSGGSGIILLRLY